MNLLVILLLALALASFIAVAFGTTVLGSVALLPLGLAFWVTSSLVVHLS